MATKTSTATRTKPERKQSKAKDKQAEQAMKPSTQQPTKQAKASKASKNAKGKVSKERFRFPAEDYALFAPLKARAKQGGRPAKKGELVRVGLRILITLDESVLIEQLRQLDAKPARRS